jgi:hypothetical protein
MKNPRLCVSAVLIISLFGCGDDNSSDSEKESPTTEVSRTKFPLVGLPKAVLPYVACGNQGKAYDRPSESCRDLQGNEKALQGFYRHIDEQNVLADEFTIEVIGNVHIETYHDGDLDFYEVELRNVRDFSEPDQVGFDCAYRMTLIENQQVVISMDVRAESDSQGKSISFTRPPFLSRYVSAANPRNTAE